jgi:hypothetical protein
MMSKTLNQVWNYSIKETSLEQEHIEEVGEAREKRNKIEALKELVKLHLATVAQPEPKAVPSSKKSTDLIIPGNSRGQRESTSKEVLIHIEDIKQTTLHNKQKSHKRHTSARAFQKVLTGRKISENRTKNKFLGPRTSLPEGAERSPSNDDSLASEANINRNELQQQTNSTYPMRRVQTEAEMLTKNIELKVFVVEVSGNKLSKSSLAKIAWRRSFQDNPLPEASKIEIPEHRDVELEVYADGRDEPLKKFSGVSCKPASSEKPYCDMVIVDVSQHRHLIRVDREESALFKEPDINDSSPQSSTEERVNRREWNCTATATDSQLPMDALLVLVRGSGTENAELHNGFLLESEEGFGHVLVKTTANGRIYFKDDRAIQSRILIYERSFIEVGPEKIHCYLVTTERDILESKKNKPVHMEYLCVASESELLVEPYGYLEGEFAELCLSDGDRFLGQLYFEKLQNIPASSEPMFTLKFKISSSKHYTLNLKPTHLHNTLEARLAHLCMPLLSKYQEMSSSKTQTAKPSKPKTNGPGGLQDPSLNRQAPPAGPTKTSLPKITLRDKRGATVLIYLGEEDSIDSSDLSDSFESDCFYPDDEIYRVEVNGKLHAPVFKKLRSGAAPKPQTSGDKVASAHTAIPRQGHPDSGRTGRSRHCEEQDRLRRQQEVARPSLRLSDPSAVPRKRLAGKRQAGEP